MLSSIERRQDIVQRTQAEGRVLVAELARQYAVSAVTVRGDLNDLARNGLVVRCRGGAITSTRLTRELSVQERYKEHLPIKQRLGRAVAALVSTDEAIIIDSGTSTEAVAHCLTDHPGLVVMTNGLNIASVLADIEGIEVRITGGTLRQKSLSFYGRQAENSLRNMHFDKLILGVDGFDLEAGITTHFEPEALLNRLMCDLSSEIIAVTDSSKFNRRGFHIIRASTEISTLVTDSGIPDNYAQALTEAGVKLCLVEG